MEKLLKILEELDISQKGVIEVSSLKEALKDKAEYEDISLLLEHSEVIDDKINYLGRIKIKLRFYKLNLWKKSIFKRREMLFSF